MSFSRRTLLVGGAALTCLAFVPATAKAIDAGSGKLIDDAVNGALVARAGPGIQVAIADRSGVMFSRGYGVGDLGRKSPINAQSVFRIGSLTKQFTAAAVIKLSANGKLKLDAPVATYLRFMSKLQPVSVLELMHHTAGLHSDESDVSPSAGPHTQAALAEEIATQKVPFDFEPGTAWLYSNANYIVLGAIIEAVTGISFAQAMADLIFKPLGLDATAVDSASDPGRGQVTGYSPIEGDAAFEKAAYLEISDAGGAGAMRSTVSDLCLWHRRLLSNKLFEREFVALMTAPGKLRDGRLSGANRFSADDVHYGETQYACGLLVSPAADAHPNILHYGAINGFSAVLQTWTDHGVTMAVLCNGDIGPAAPFRAIRQIVTAKLLSRGP